MKIRTALLLLCVGVPASLTASARAAPDDGIGEEFRQTLLRLAESGELPTLAEPLVIDRPAERVANFGLLVDRDHQEGLLVLGTLPGGSAERLGLNAGDRLVEANGIDLTGSGGGQRMRSLLDGLDNEDAMALRVLRGGQEQRLTGTIAAVQLPAMRVELFAADAGTASADDVGRVPGDSTSSCGRISTFAVAPRARDLFKARLIQVDGELPGPSSQDTFRLAPGLHELTVAEIIDERYFSSIANRQRSRGGRDTYKTLTVDVQPGVTYLLAARFHRDRSGSILDGGYWQPVIWKENTEPCD